MSAATTASPIHREPELRGQTVVVIGGSSGIGLETARRARAEGAEVILAARDPDRLQRVGRELGASIAAFDAADFERLGKFFDELRTPIDHVLVTGPGPYYAPLAEFDVEKARRDVDAHLLLPLQVARNAAGKVRPRGDPALHGWHRWPPHGGGTRVHLGSHGRASGHDEEPRARARAHPRQPDRGRVRRQPLSAAILGDQLDTRREQLRATLPIRRVVGPADIAALAVHLMTNTAVTGATFDIDGGQQLVER